ncbi:GNAT family protein [Bacillus carboniphilus]|uniref:GNAT family protein n=1 Tax=Bacillus carboniphilus TaxID=86663 RepID=A0ABY9JTM5_9BACI|nr:GNAT family protein [Bacillus carboniphilus]WLR41777.1 GNAT family protein [Bacillus carboniphilus]
MKQFFNHFLTGRTILLKQMEQHHLEQFAQFENETGALLLANDDIPFPTKIEDTATFFNNISSKKEEFIFGIFDKESNELIGSCGVFAINWKNSTCYVGISIGSQWQNKGFGTDTMNTLISFIFHYININKIKLQVFSFNSSAIRSYEKCSFKKEGILRNEIFRFGTFHDVYLYGLLREEWNEGQII